MTVEMLVALIGFAFVMSISPGPGNFILLTSGVNFGFLRSIPIVLGISFGFLAMVLAVGLGLGATLTDYPAAVVVLKIASAVYIFHLAFRIARSKPSADKIASTSDRPITFAQASLLQLVNPKAWAVALIVTVSYTTPANYIPSLLLMIAVFAIVNLPALSVWALFGVGLRRLLTNPAKVRVFNGTMAILLVGSTIPVLLDAPIKF